jgi:hypothetical protein
MVYYKINGHTYNKCYYLVDGIYLYWFILVFEKRGLSNNKRLVERM